MTYELAFLRSLGATVAVETLILMGSYLFLMRKRMAPRRSFSFLLFAGAFPSAATLPYLWFILPGYLSSFTSLFWGGESFVVCMEALFFRMVFPLSWRTSLLLSLWCNLCSVLAGHFFLS